ncbi:MAG: helix-turn-helix domain-containing protein [Cyclobacteriaceae bacterium]
MLTKSVLGNQIKVLRLEKGLSQEEFGAPVDLSRSAVSQIESGQMYPSLESIDKIVKYYSTSWDNLVGHTKGKKPAQMTVSPVRTLVTTVDKTGRDNIVLVPIKAQAGYLQGAQQPEYIEHLPTFWLPGLNHGTYRAFEVSGYSMLADRTGFFPGDIVVGEYVERLEEIKDGFVYILVNNAQEVDNIVLKRCLNYLDKGGVIICKSDNKDPQYPTFPLPVENIKEVWKFKIKLTRQAPEPSGLYERINALEGDMVLLKEQLRKAG